MNPVGVEGYPTPVVLDGADSVLWWMPGELDLVATSDKRLVVWPDVEQALAGAHALGWRIAVTADEVDEPVDADHVAQWVHGKVLRLDPRRALGVWNLADDVSTTLGLVRARGGRVADGCHTKLTASAVPWAFGRERYDPRWTPRELAVLRLTLDRCVVVLRHAIRCGTSLPCQAGGRAAPTCPPPSSALGGGRASGSLAARMTVSAGPPTSASGG